MMIRKKLAEPAQKAGSNMLPPLCPHSKKIDCFDCGRKTELGGYRFAASDLVPICAACRIEREVQIINNRFKRRQAGGRN